MSRKTGVAYDFRVEEPARANDAHSVRAHVRAKQPPDTMLPARFLVGHDSAGPLAVLHAYFVLVRVFGEKNALGV